MLDPERNDMVPFRARPFHDIGLLGFFSRSDLYADRAD